MASSPGYEDSDLAIAAKVSQDTHAQEKSFDQALIDAAEREIRESLHRYTFYHLYQVLMELALIQGGGVRIRPCLSLAMPRSEVNNFARIDDEGIFSYYSMDVNLPGLYGSSSPLPSFYTEELIYHENESNNSARILLDLFHQQLYQLLIDGIDQCRAVKNDFSDDLPVLQIAKAIAGLDYSGQKNELVQNYQSRYMQLFKKKQRSTIGLKLMLEDFLGGINVDLEECVTRKVKLARSNRLVLGAQVQSLGDNALIGDRIEDSSLALNIIIGPIGAKKYQLLINDNLQWSTFCQLTMMYINQPLYCFFTFQLKKSEANTVILGAKQWSKLGNDTWLYSKVEQGEVTALYARHCIVATEHI